MSVLRLTPERYAELQRKARRRSPGPKPGATSGGARPSKYGNVKTDGPERSYASKREARRAAELALEAKAGSIAALEEQKRFILIAAQYDKGGRLLERECAYVADFVYLRDGAVVVEDTKGYRTEIFKIKKKLMLQRYGIRITET